MLYQDGDSEEITRDEIIRYTKQHVEPPTGMGSNTDPPTGMGSMDNTDTIEKSQYEDSLEIKKGIADLIEY